MDSGPGMLELSVRGEYSRNCQVEAGSAHHDNTTVR